MTKEEATKLLDDVLDRLGEHFDSVQIICTLVEDGTKHYHRGTGDFYARRGAVDKWIRDDSAEDETWTRIRVEREEDKDDWQRREYFSRI